MAFFLHLVLCPDYKTQAAMKSSMLCVLASGSAVEAMPVKFGPTHSFPLVYGCFCLQLCNSVVAIETTSCSTNPKIFTIWLENKFANLLSIHEQW